MKLFDAGATLLVFFVVSSLLLGVAKVGFMIADKEECKQEQTSDCEE